MTPEEGYELAKKQRPGVKIVMGPTKAREERMAPVNIMTCLKWALSLPGDTSWWAYDVRKVCGGWLPHSFALSAGWCAETIVQRPLTRADWEHLHNGSAEDHKTFVRKRMEEARARKYEIDRENTTPGSASGCLAFQPA